MTLILIYEIKKICWKVTLQIGIVGHWCWFMKLRKYVEKSPSKLVLLDCPNLCKHYNVWHRICIGNSDNILKRDLNDGKSKNTIWRK